MAEKLIVTELKQRRCVPCEGGGKALSQPEAEKLLKQVNPRWKLLDSGKKIEANFEFKNFFRTTAFINAAVYVAISEDHHPDFAFGYKNATLTFSTHAVNGVSDNDFICAAKIDQLLE